MSLVNFLGQRGGGSKAGSLPSRHQDEAGILRENSNHKMSTVPRRMGIFSGQDAGLGAELGRGEFLRFEKI